MGSLHLNKTPPAISWLSDALSVQKTGLKDENDNPDTERSTPRLDVVTSATVSQRLAAVVGNDTGADISAVRVQFWAYACATVPTPKNYLTSMGGTKGTQAQQVQPVPNNLTRGFDFNWDTSTGLDSGLPEIQGHLQPDGTIHCCIFANVFANAQDHIPDDPVNGPAPKLDVANNPRHAQRNMTIKVKATVNAMKLMVYAGNPDAEREQEIGLFVNELEPTDLDAWMIDELAEAGPWIRRSRERFGEGTVPGLEILLDGELIGLPTARRKLEDLTIEVGDICAPEARLTLGPAESERMMLNATIPDDEFALRMIEVTQTHHGEIAGGARFLMLHVPEELLSQRYEPEEPEEPEESGY